MLTTDMARVDGGLARLAWPACISPDHREALKRKYGLRDRRVTFLDRYEALGVSDRTDVRGALARHNAFPAIFDDGLPCVCLSDLAATIRDPIKSIFEFAFNLLTDLGLRDTNYKRLYDELDYKVCAFCGVELLDAPGQKREALDHYLPIASYPFAGTNFRNLSPMGTKCNSRYKLQQDILVDSATGNRRACCDPYDSPTISLSLNDSRPFDGPRVNLVTCPEWDIQWEGGDPDKLRTWESVFAISERYRESSLNPNFRGWIDHFCRWAARQPNAANNPDLVRDLLSQFSEIVIPDGFAEAAFLKRATFQMLAVQCNATEDGLRIFDWLYEQIVECRTLLA
ncbi:hypothetical protein [Sphingobium yanoikuyae]|uniref:hypothetical protein n=1 Tax=Sphingobium yanoikuyae TaxID=13690 RepID=UPI0022DD5C7F|nr:hypothetical protein [Sphingobium yanoikuyae]WBQ18978.1 hypothetical protein PAE53_24285 [Sphingobium yanoikuyae]